MSVRHTDPDTSRKADEDVQPRRQSQQERLLIAYLTNPDGLTDEEAADWADLPPRSCWWKRCSELREHGLIIPTGQVRIGSMGSERMVCRPTPAAWCKVGL